jgi:hypothetical protein
MKRKAGLILLGLLTGLAEIWLGWMVLPENFLGAYLIFIGLGYCIGGGFFLALGTNKGTESRSDSSLVSFAPGGFLILLGMPLEYLYLSEVLPRSQAIQWLGLTIILLGMILRLWARRSLGSTSSKQALTAGSGTRDILHLPCKLWGWLWGFQAWWRCWGCSSWHLRCGIASRLKNI